MVQMGFNLLLNHMTARMNHKLAHQAAFHQHFNKELPYRTLFIETLSRAHTPTSVCESGVCPKGLLLPEATTSPTL